jgi:hypothetical protein
MKSLKVANHNVTLSKRIFRDELRRLCIDKDWYTCGDIVAYDNLFNMLHEDMDDAEIVGICIDIYDHTDVERISNEDGVSYEDIFDNIVFEVYELVHTFVEVCIKIKAK